jgi:hypothetical protein
MMSFFSKLLMIGLAFLRCDAQQLRGSSSRQSVPPEASLSTSAPNATVHMNSTDHTRAVIDVDSMEGQCFETSDGMFASVNGRENAIVWDPDVPSCGPEGSFIHFAGDEFIHMTAGKGALKHVYHVATFSNNSGYVDKVGGCAATPSGGSREVTWFVANTARGGSC